MGLFTNPIVPDNQKHAILDTTDGSVFYIDDEYRHSGESEGWLIYDGYRIEADNTILHLYRY